MPTKDKRFLSINDKLASTDCCGGIFPRLALGHKDVGVRSMRERHKPPFLTDDWMLEQQVRAELEAEAWRRMREERASPAPSLVAATPASAPPAQLAEPGLGGSAILKALVRFIMGALAGCIAYIAALDSQLGEFEAWLALGAAFIVTLALSMFAPMRRLVHVLAEAARWGLVGATALGAVWIFTQLLQ